MKNKIVVIVSWMLVIISAGFIFYMSACDGNTSAEQSGRVVKVIEEIINDPVKAKEAEGVVRETAHSAEFFLLGFLLMNALLQTAVRRKELITLVIGFLYACSDEIHQIWIPGRTSELIDLLIDTVGVTVAIAVFYVCEKCVKALKERKE